jgi:hypothetical protein
LFVLPIKNAILPGIAPHQRDTASFPHMRIDSGRNRSDNVSFYVYGIIGYFWVGVNDENL